MASTSTTTSSHPLPRPSSLVPTITPASLASLAIYNPSLGTTDETLADQIVFYTSHPGLPPSSENDKLRQVGLAQGVVEFARGFSQSDDFTAVETENSRIITLETEEPGWWIFVKIELTYIHNPTVQPPTSGYSSREVSPPRLLAAQLRRAYAQFRFRYGTFEENFTRLGRPGFVKRLHKYWHRWARGRWEVLLKGSPAVDILLGRGVKMAGGKAGCEIGEQERGFLEGWVKKEMARGLVDVVVSRFGQEQAEDANRAAGSQASKDDSGPWFWRKNRESSPSGSGKRDQQFGTTVQPTDGCVFRGRGELSARSIMDITIFLAEMYEADESSTSRNPSQLRRRRKPRPRTMSHLAMSTPADGNTSAEGSPRNSTSTIRPAIRESAEEADLEPMRSVDPTPETEAPPSTPLPLEPMRPIDPAPEPEAPMKPIDPNPSAEAPPSTPPSPEPNTNTSSKVLQLLTFSFTRSSPSPSPSSSPAPTSPTPQTPQHGRFTIGFHGDLTLSDMDDDAGRITSRSVHIVRTTSSQLEELKLVVYVHGALMFAFLYPPDCAHLTQPSFYRSIHHQLSPLSLQPAPVSKTWDLVLDVEAQSVYSTIPSIPEPGEEVNGWRRADAVGVYGVVLGLMEGAEERGERERSVRSAKGWWVSWGRFGRGEGVVVRKSAEVGRKEKKKQEGDLGVGGVGRYFEGLVGGR